MKEEMPRACDEDKAEKKEGQESPGHQHRERLIPPSFMACGSHRL